MRVVATAGHVDHGKSSLVLALTGTDPDRFAEEKARGLTIDLGFAFTTLPSGTELGFVDVPGHVRFLKNMLAGVGAVEVALLVVAATEGWMAQTEEHHRILELLGIAHGVVAVTKADLVDPERVATVVSDVERRLGPTALADAPIVVCDARSGRGMHDLALALDAVLAAAPAPADAGRPRLWIDRVFSARGAGTVVTGTLVGGSVTRDDELEAVPLERRVRVRGVQSAHHHVDVATSGTRVACNLVGVDHHELRRGDALVRAGQWTITDAVDVALTTFPDVELSRRGRGHVYVGSGEHACGWRVFGDGRYARVTFSAALALAPGDRLVLRDPGREQIVAGATVLDAEAIGRVDDGVHHLDLDTPERFVRARGRLARRDLARVAGLADAVAAHQAERVVADGRTVAIDDWLVDPATADTARRAVRAHVDQHHRAHPTDPGIALAVLGERLALDDARTRAVATSTPGIVVEHGRAHDVAHTGSAASDPAATALLAALDAQPFTPPAPTDRALTRALVREGVLVDVNGIVFTASAVDGARALVADTLARQGEVTVGDVRALLDSTRKYVVPLLEWFDSQGVTRRRGDVRVAGPRVNAPLGRQL